MFSKKPRNARQLEARPTRARRFRASAQRQQVARRRPAAREQGPLLPGLARAAGLVGARLALFLGVGLVLVGGWAVLAESPLGALRAAEVRGTHQLSRLDVLSAAGVGSRTSLFRMNVAEAAQSLGELPWVRAASVERRLGGRVVLTVQEYQPSALALVEGRFLFLDQTLTPFATLAGEGIPDLPVISGLSKAEWLQPDEEVERLKQKALALLRGLPTGETDPGGRLSEINLDRVWGLSVMYGDLPCAVRLGVETPLKRLERLAAVVADLKGRGELGRARLIDLGDDRRVVVRLWREAA